MPRSPNGAGNSRCGERGANARFLSTASLSEDDKAILAKFARQDALRLRNQPGAPT
jgi:hypothetical protein